MSAGTSSEETTAAAGVASAVAGPLGGEPTVLGLLYAGTIAASTGGRALPLGRPLI
jgi:hypothetical protein